MNCDPKELPTKEPIIYKTMWVIKKKISQFLYWVQEYDAGLWLWVGIKNTAYDFGSKEAAENWAKENLSYESGLIVEEI